MKVRELRIGNLIYNERNNVGIVKIIYPNRVECEIEEPEWAFGKDRLQEIFNFKPIPLTEEWLMRFGFIKDEWSFIFPINNGNTAYSIDWYGDKLGFAYAGDITKETWIYYVHQLQNLYFALTGKELVEKKEE